MRGCVPLMEGHFVSDVARFDFFVGAVTLPLLKPLHLFRGVSGLSYAGNVDRGTFTFTVINHVHLSFFNCKINK